MTSNYDYKKQMNQLTRWTYIIIYNRGLHAEIAFLSKIKNKILQTDVTYYSFSRFVTNEIINVFNENEAKIRRIFLKIIITQFHAEFQMEMIGK